jgi:dienelactone hydrolase
MAVYVKALAEAGYAVVMPHYLHGYSFGSGKDAIIAVVGRHAEWCKVIEAVFDFIRDDSRFDSSRLAAVGFSLGANLAIGLGMANPPPKLQAVASFFAPITAPSPGTSWSTVPRILLLHSTADSIVPIVEMHAAISALKAVGKSEGPDYHVVEYEGDQHSFVEPDLSKSIAELLGFLKATLGA